MTESELRQKCALTASNWLGTREGSEGHRELLEIYNRIRPLPRGYAMQERDPWCAAFVSASAVMAGVEELVPLECSCSKIIEKAQRMGIWVENDDHVPGIGDWVLYRWKAPQNGDDTGSPDHVGVVTDVENGMISVVEGNYDNAVGLRKIPVNARSIRGFVCPEFGRAASEESAVIHSIREVPEYARATIEKLISDGSLRGVGEDDLGLSLELIRILVILDRRGIL